MTGVTFTRRQALCSTIACVIAGCSRDSSNKEEPGVTKTQDPWDRIHKWLSAHAPKILRNLNAGAGDSEIVAAERALGQKMPQEWRDLYRAHDGMNTDQNTGSLFFGMQFLPLERVLREQTNNDVKGAKPLPVRAADPGIRLADMHNPKWIAFAHDCGNTLLRVDLDPGEGGRVGQVIFTDHADDTVIVLAPSLPAFLAEFAGDLEAGRYFLDKDALADGNEFLNCKAEIDVVNWSFSPRWKHLAR
jgi:cell wall assembly regulator SMI1